MREKLLTLLNSEFRDIINNSLVLDLISIYSYLYLNGNDPGHCEKCLSKYYSELKKNGMAQLNKMEEVRKRTLVPRFLGIIDPQKNGTHINTEMLTDKEAIEYLKKGVLRESHFKKLPDAYKSKKTTTPKMKNPPLPPEKKVEKQLPKSE